MKENEQQQPQKKCVACDAEKTCRWRRSKLQIRATLCDKCYRSEALTLTQRTCFLCKSEKTTGQWFKSKVDGSFDLCRNCWVKEHAMLANKVCVNCKSKKTSSQWLKSKIIEGADLCNNCYQKEVYQMNKFTNTTERKNKKIVPRSNLDILQMMAHSTLPELLAVTARTAAASQNIANKQRQHSKKKDDIDNNNINHFLEIGKEDIQQNSSSL